MKTENVALDQLCVAWVCKELLREPKKMMSSPNFGPGSLSLDFLRVINALIIITTLSIVFIIIIMIVIIIISITTTNSGVQSAECFA